MLPQHLELTIHSCVGNQCATRKVLGLPGIANSMTRQGGLSAAYDSEAASAEQGWRVGWLYDRQSSRVRSPPSERCCIQYIPRIAYNSIDRRQCRCILIAGGGLAAAVRPRSLGRAHTRK